MYIVMLYNLIFDTNIFLLQLTLIRVVLPTIHLSFCKSIIGCRNVYYLINDFDSKVSIAYSTNCLKLAPLDKIIQIVEVWHFTRKSIIHLPFSISKCLSTLCIGHLTSHITSRIFVIHSLRRAKNVCNVESFWLCIVSKVQSLHILLCTSCVLLYYKMRLERRATEKHFLHCQNSRKVFPIMDKILVCTVIAKSMSRVPSISKLDVF